MTRVQIRGTTIFGYVQDNYLDIKLKKIGFLDEETKQTRKVSKNQIRPAYEKDRYN